MATHPKLIRQKPLTVWSLRERLMLASSVLQSGDQNWVSVSRAIRNHSTESRPHEYFSQKNCALQYGELLEKAETPKRKRSEKNEVIPVETQGLQIVNKLRLEYMQHLVEQIKKQQKDYFQLSDEIEMINGGQCDEKLKEMWEEIQEKQQAEKEIVATPTISQSETTSDLDVSTQSASAPDVMDTSSQESQEQDIEVQVDDQCREPPSVKEEVVESSVEQPVTSVDNSVDNQLTSESEPVADAAATTSATPAAPVVPGNTAAKEETVEIERSSQPVMPEEPVQPTPPEEDVKTEPSPTLPPTDDDSTNDEAVDVEEVSKPVEPPTQTTAHLSSKTPSHSIKEKKTTPEFKSNQQLSVSVVPAELERTLSPEISTPATEAKTLKGSRRRSNRVVPKAKDDVKKEEAASVTSVSTTSKAASEIVLSSEDEEPPAISTKSIESPPASPAISQQSETEDDKNHKAWKKRVLTAWRVVSQHKYANVFMHQVTDDIAPGYSKCVYRPMSLSLIKQNVEKNMIKTTDEFTRDMMLMFVNAIMYNNHEYDVYAMAQEMCDTAMAVIKEHMQSKDGATKSNTLRERRSDVASGHEKSEKESEKSRRRSSADQDLSHPPGKRRKTRADN